MCNLMTYNNMFNDVKKRTIISINNAKNDFFIIDFICQTISNNIEKYNLKNKTHNFHHIILQSCLSILVQCIIK